MTKNEARAYAIRQIMYYTDGAATRTWPTKGGGPIPPHQPPPPYCILIEDLHKLGIKNAAALQIEFTMTEYQPFLDLSVLVYDVKDNKFIETTSQTVDPKLGTPGVLNLSKDDVQKIDELFKNGKNSLSLSAVSYTAPALLEFSVRNKNNKPL